MRWRMRLSRAIFFEPALRGIFDTHRQMIELRAAQKLNAGLFDPNRSVLIDADDI